MCAAPGSAGAGGDGRPPGEVNLYTASFRAYRPWMGQPVVTARGLPAWLPEAEQWPRCWMLTPGSAYFDAEPDEFERQYLAQLDRHGPAKIARWMARTAREHNTDRLVLLCHEADWTRCHRMIAARWFLERAGELVGELIT